MKKLILFLLLISSQLHAVDFKKSVSAGLGMNSFSLKELVATTETVDSYSGTAINFFLGYDFMSKFDKTFSVAATVPFLTNDGLGLYRVSLVMKTFINALSAPYEFENEGDTFLVTPKGRMYWAPFIGAGIAVYTLGRAKKSDFVYDLGFLGGYIYNFNNDWDIVGEAGASKGFGINTDVLSYFASLSAAFSF